MKSAEGLSMEGVEPARHMGPRVEVGPMRGGGLRASWRMGLVLLIVSVLGCQPSDPELGDYGEVPAFAFVDQLGQPIGTEQLKGRPWVASFAFTSCPTSCPPLMEAQASLQKKVAQWAGKGEQAPVTLVTITVDPVTDTQERLKTYGERYGADPKLWRFARGDYTTMAALVTEGFMMPLVRSDVVPGHVGEEIVKPTPLDTAHSLRFVLVDKEMRIRGLYQREEEDLERLNRALRTLVEQHKDPS
ncbi:MAG: SCO family protein [Myxococcota bacterium]